MILRYLATQLMRQAAEQKVRGAVTDALKQRIGELSQEMGELAQGLGDGKTIERPDKSEGQATPVVGGRFPIVCLFALGIECGGFVDLLKECKCRRQGSLIEYAGLLHDRPLAVVESGVGAERAASATEELISFYQPKWVVSAGFAGALDEKLRRGHFLMADTVVDEKGATLDVGLKMSPEQIAAVKGLHVGRLVSVDRLIRTRAEREKLAAAHGALACDMESAAVAEVCRRRHTRFLSVRIISDGLDEKLPPEVERLLAQPSAAGKAGAAIAALIRRPSAVKDLWKLRDQAIETSDKLAKFLAGVVAQLENTGVGE
jgi:adenosylhomocysteine nucleosidase